MTRENQLHAQTNKVWRSWQWLKKHRINLLRISLIMLLTMLALWASWLNYANWVITNSELGRFFSSILKDIGPELAGIVIGVVTIDYLNERRQEQQFKTELIRRMTSKDSREEVMNALRELRAHGWLKDGSLKNADLEGALLNKIDLDGADLRGANLEKAVLNETLLRKADLRGANLKGAYLMLSDLSRAKLQKANLEGAYFITAILDGADFSGAIVDEEDLKRAWLRYEDLILPNGKKWKGWREIDSNTGQAINQELPNTECIQKEVDQLGAKGKPEDWRVW